MSDGKDAMVGSPRASVTATCVKLTDTRAEARVEKSFDRFVVFSSN